MKVFEYSRIPIMTLLPTATLIILSHMLYAQGRIPQFEDYHVNDKYVVKNAPIILPKQARMFRSRLKDAARQKPNFAGHYILATWGCGMECLMGAVIDARTGKVYQIPFTICCWGNDGSDSFTPIEYKADSKLIIFNGARDEKVNDRGKHYYLFEKNRFIAIQPK